MVYHHLQPAFNGGEISPHAAARADGSVFSAWLKTAKNLLIHPQGGVSNRPGMVFVARAKFEDKTVRLLPFVLGDNEAYILELGDKYLRVHTSSGPFLGEDASPWEVATPYSQYDVSQLQYAQYNQTLYLAHGSYPVYKFFRSKQGVFNFEEVNLTGGPFMPLNTDETRKMRLTQEGGSISVEGVAASVSFQPKVYSYYAIRAFFRGQGFYLDGDYGCNIQAMVERFNATFGAESLQAVNAGGVVTITSPKETGGDYNGAELVIHYLRDITQPPQEVAVYRLSGGANAGALVGEEDAKQILESDFDFFVPSLAGGFFSLRHEVESQYVSGSIGYDGTSQQLKSGGDWRFKTAGSWSGSAVLEKSSDGGLTWSAVKHFSREENGEHLNEFGSLSASSQLYLLRLRAENISGNLEYEMWSDLFIQEAVLKLKTYINSRKMEVEVSQQAASQDWSSRWAQGSFSPQAGYPACVFFYQDRLGFACTQSEPQTLWFSKTSQYEDFGHLRTQQEADGFSLNLNGKTLNSIRSVAVSGKLFVFTSGSEWTVSSSGAFSAYNVTAAQQSQRGGSTVPALLAGGRVLFVQARGGVLRDFVYDYSTDSYAGDDLTLLARHLFFNREIKALCFQQEPDALIWCLMSDGSLLTLTYLPGQKICAWGRQETQGRVLSLCCMPSSGYDEMWFAIQRPGGVFIEKLSPRLATKEPQEQLFLDSAVCFSSSEGIGTLAGLEHLEGQAVYALADGLVQGPFTVSGGYVTLPNPAKTVYVGLAYEAKLVTLPLELNLTDGTSRDRKRRAVGVILLLADSRGGFVGPEGGKLDELVYAPQTDYTHPPSLQDVLCEKVFSSNHQLLKGVEFKQTQPLPVTLLNIIVKSC